LGRSNKFSKIEVEIGKPRGEVMLKRLIGILSICSLFPHLASAESTEERFHDIFITAGYATAIGAGLGAASLSFYKHPEEKLKHVAIGASLGFIGGTILGSYIVLAPVIGSIYRESPEMLAMQSRSLSIQPIVTENLTFSGLVIGSPTLNF
jgi:hypothetical protein